MNEETKIFIPLANLRKHLPEIEDIARPFNNRQRYEGRIIGALELAYLRGYQGGFDDAREGKRPRHYVNPKKPKKRKKK